MTIEEFVKKIIQYDKIEVVSLNAETDKYGEEIFVARVKLPDDESYRCPICGKRGEKHGYKLKRVKRWRSLDFGKNKFYIESELPRVRCEKCGVHAQKVPWALHDSDYTYAFDLRVAYLSAMSSTNLVAKQMRVKWATVGNCVKRVQESMENFTKPLSLPEKIAIDETSWKKGYKYITTVQNLENGEIIWAAEGYGKSVLEKFFQQYTTEELKSIKYVVADGAKYITSCVEEFCPSAARCVDPYHVIQWANEELDNTRKRLASDIKKNGFRC
jgi:transposase